MSLQILQEHTNIAHQYGLSLSMDLAKNCHLSSSSIYPFPLQLFYLAPCTFQTFYLLDIRIGSATCV